MWNAAGSRHHGLSHSLRTTSRHVPRDIEFVDRTHFDEFMAGRCRQCFHRSGQQRLKEAVVGPPFGE